MLFLLVISGLLVGFLSSFFGVGGGLVAIPTFYFLFPHITPQEAIACSLGVIFLNSLSNTFNFYRVGRRPNTRVIIFLSFFMVLGSFIGSHLILYTSPILIKKIFSIFLLLISLKIIFSARSKKTEGPVSWQFKESQQFWLKILMIGFVGGLVSGVTGLGGGIILIPLFHTYLQMPFQLVPVYTNPAMVFGCVAGVISAMVFSPLHEALLPKELQPFQVGLINWAIVLLTFVGSFVTSGFGAKLAQKLGAPLIEKLFVFLLLTFSLKTFFD